MIINPSDSGLRRNGGFFLGGRHGIIYVLPPLRHGVAALRQVEAQAASTETRRHIRTRGMTQTTEGAYAHPWVIAQTKAKASLRAPNPHHSGKSPTKFRPGFPFDECTSGHNLVDFSKMQAVDCEGDRQWENFRASEQ